MEYERRALEVCGDLVKQSDLTGPPTSYGIAMAARAIVLGLLAIADAIRAVSQR